MIASEGIRVVDVDGELTDAFVEYARRFGPVHDDSYVMDENLASFDPAVEPAVLAFDGSDAPLGAASVMLAGYANEGLSRFRILHASDPTLYPLLIDAVLARLPQGISRAFLFLPEHADEIVDALATAGFAESRRSYIMLHTSPGAVAESELPAETVLEEALPTSGGQWANVVNAAFRGQPGRYDMSESRAAELLARPRVIRGGTLLACRGGTPSGIVLTVGDEHSPYSAEIETLAVVPADQHVGLGRAMLRAAVRAAGHDGRTSVMLSVSTFNKRALAMYLGAGFGVHDVRVCWEKRLA
jgi:ribosomal protein S18 acetylase RimI-like enzyme